METNVPGLVSNALRVVLISRSWRMQLLSAKSRRYVPNFAIDHGLHPEGGRGLANHLHCTSIILYHMTFLIVSSTLTDMSSILPSTMSLMLKVGAGLPNNKVRQVYPFTGLPNLSIS